MRGKGLLPWAGLLAGCGLMAACEHDLLWVAQEQSLFLATPMFFQQCIELPGGGLSWAAAFLTQFFHYPMLGAGLMGLLWAFLMWLLKRAFDIPRGWMWLTLLPVAMLLLGCVELGYWVYFLKLRGHLLVATLGCMGAALLFWAYRGCLAGWASPPCSSSAPRWRPIR